MNGQACTSCQHYDAFAHLFEMVRHLGNNYDHNGLLTT